MQPDTPLLSVKGVGPKTAELFAAAGLSTVDDLVHFFPRTYDDYSRVTTVSALQPGKVSLRGRFEEVHTRRVRRGMTVTEATFTDSTGKVAVVWFNQAYRVQQVSTDKEFLVSGEFGLQRNKYQLVNPSVELLDGGHASTGRIVPVYRQVMKLKTQLVRKVLLELRPYILALDETLPLEIVDKEHLMSYADAVSALHFPEGDQQLEQAKQRMGFEEMLALVTASQQNRADNDAQPGFQMHFEAQDAQDFVKKLPFTLTDAQRVAAWEAIQNLASERPMNRLLQGDVGSGKTVVAGLVAYIASRSGFQTAFMAPTELLVTQHAETLQRLLEPFQTNIALLTGSVKGKHRQQVYDHISQGSVAVVVGTHALIQEKVAFHKLGFVVIDEQHRFGVEQRQKLLAKSGGRMPHLLAMTATPIPRSLQLTVYGELDVSILGEKPKNRRPIHTSIISPNSRAQMYEAAEKEIISGRQVYVVCPLIEEKEPQSTTGDFSSDRKSVEAEVKRLRQGPFRHRRIGLLHGKLKSEEKQAVMSDFAAGKLDILVSTTVVEVGVDVPNATVMIVEAADTFGLAQLHQLRGRVGRSDRQSYCYLVTSTSQKPSRRLRELERSNDGFYLAEKDLELRGPGEIYGRAQHGALNLQFARISDTRLLSRVQRWAKWLIAHPEHIAACQALRRAIDRSRHLTSLN
ncbi:MAG: ATP-dependent DNA helicase RecG [Acidobacteriota bacterium]